MPEFKRIIQRTTNSERVESGVAQLEPNELCIVEDTEELIYKNKNGKYVSISKDKDVIDTIESLKKSTKYKIGDVVKVQGYLNKGDGEQHERILKISNDGTGIETPLGWWCIVKNSLLSNKEHRTKSYERAGNIATWDRMISQKSYHFFGDSHSYGQGTRGDFGLFKASTHATRYGARTWSTMLKDLLNFMWGKSPKTFNSPNVMMRNKITETSSFNVIQGKIISSNIGGFTATEQDRLNIWEQRDTNDKLQMFNYNMSSGFYWNHWNEINAESIIKDLKNSYTFVPGSFGFSVWDGNGRWAIKENITRLDGSIKTIPYFITYVGDEILNNLNKGHYFHRKVNGAESGFIGCFVEDVIVVGNKVAIGFSNADGSILTEENLRLSYSSSEIFQTIKTFNPIIISAPVGEPTHLVGFTVFTGPYQYFKQEVSFTPTVFRGNYNNTAGDLYCVHSNTDPTLIKKTSNSTMGLVNLSTEGIVKEGVHSTFKIDGSLLINSENPYECRYYWLMFNNATTGVVNIKTHIVFNKSYRDPSVSLTQIPSLLTRGFQVNDMTKIMTHGFGCHSVGDLIGRTTDICGHDSGQKFDHIEKIKLCECLNIPTKRFAIQQAPLVNEYLRQTPIEQYKSDLTEMYNKLFEGSINANKRFIIFTGAGQIGHDDYLGPITTSNPITYAMYRLATKEWAESIRCTYIDAGYEQKKLIDEGKAVPEDFIMTLNDDGGGSWDSNHPTMYTHMLWFEALKDIVLRKFQ